MRVNEKTKICLKCNAGKSAEDFRKWRRYCRACEASAMRDYRKMNPPTEEQRKNNSDYAKEWRRNNAQWQYEYRQRNRDKIRTKEIRLALWRHYRITPEDYAQMFAAQAGVCAICHKPNADTGNSDSVRRLHVDHDHKTGKIRGLLCTACNSVIGFVRDDESILLSAVDYLRRHA